MSSVCQASESADRMHVKAAASLCRKVDKATDIQHKNECTVKSSLKDQGGELDMMSESLKCGRGVLVKGIDCGPKKPTPFEP